MSYHRLVGISPYYASNEAEFEWEIPSFIQSLPDTDKSWDSPPFYFLNAEWCLRITLNVDNNPDRWMNVYLVVRKPSASYMVTFTFAIRYFMSPLKFGPETRTFDKSSTSHGKEKFFRRGIAINSSGHYVSSLVVSCNATGLIDAECQTTSLNSTNGLCCDFQNLLLSGRYSDVTVAVRGEEFKVHKSILGVRSPVFAAMFEHDMTEKKENAIKVEDCDPHTFRNFLLCVYSGRVESLSVDEAIRLYIVSHKYTVRDIMAKCVQFLEEEFTEDTVCDVCAFANRYGETSLKQSAEEFIALNINKIISTQSWDALTAESSLLQKFSCISTKDMK